MKRALFYAIFAILTLVVGISSAWFLQPFPIGDLSLPNEADSLSKAVPAIESVTDIDILPRHRFTETFRACKPGYVQGYVTDTEQAVTEGNNRCNLEDNGATETEFNDAIRRATRIVERKEGRVVLEFRDAEEKYIEILRYNGGACISFIRAPTLELALEFEKWHSRQE